MIMNAGVRSTVLKPRINFIGQPMFVHNFRLSQLDCELFGVGRGLAWVTLAHNLTEKFGNFIFKATKKEIKRRLARYLKMFGLF